MISALFQVPITPTSISEAQIFFSLTCSLQILVTYSAPLTNISNFKRKKKRKQGEKKEGKKERKGKMKGSKEEKETYLLPSLFVLFVFCISAGSNIFFLDNKRQQHDNPASYLSLLQSLNPITYQHLLIYLLNISQIHTLLSVSFITVFLHLFREIM